MVRDNNVEVRKGIKYGARDKRIEKLACVSACFTVLDSAERSRRPHRRGVVINSS